MNHNVLEFTNFIYSYQKMKVGFNYTSQMNHNILEFTNFSHSYQEMNVIKRIMNKNVLFIDLMKVKTKWQLWSYT